MEQEEAAISGLPEEISRAEERRSGVFLKKISIQEEAGLTEEEPQLMGKRTSNMKLHSRIKATERKTVLKGLQ